MFENAIKETPFTSPAAEIRFRDSIDGTNFIRDRTFVATLRALVGPRLPKGERILLRFRECSQKLQSKEHAKQYTENELDCIFQGVNGQIVVCNFSNPEVDGASSSVDTMTEYFDELDGWQRLPKMTEFYQKSFVVSCFVNPETKSVAIFAARLNLRYMHYLQCSIFAFLPWYFDPKVGVSELEMELIQSLRERTSDRYMNCLLRLAEKYDFRSEQIREMLDGFEFRYINQERSLVSTRIEDITQRIREFNDEIGNLLKQKADQDALLLGLDQKAAEGSDGESEIMQYFLCNQSLSLVDVDDTKMVFIAKGYLEYFDEDLARAAINNPRSFIYRPDGRACDNYIKAEDMKKLMTAIFIDQTIKIRACAAYQFDLPGRVGCYSEYRYGYEFNDCTPNPHTDGFSCMGTYTSVINQLLEGNDYIGAIEQCIASCKSLNFGDSIVMSEFMRRLYGFSPRASDRINIRCIELPDGTVVDPKGAVAWLNSQEGEDSNEQSN
ncbi:MAG: hypothetical protein LUD69_05825 [Oscillospiraceae bacterium]|nr:hypothetical protein [Oscillospiraceae bacterium]